MNKQRLQFLLAAIIIFFLTACGTGKPPTELAPNGEIVKKAIALSVDLTQQRVTQQLNASHPQLNISKVNVKNLESIYLAHLPTYHLQGTYNLKVELPKQEVTQSNNLFDVYIQRQREGKTWRLVKRQIQEETEEAQWLSYRIR